MNNAALESRNKYCWGFVSWWSWHCISSPRNVLSLQFVYQLTFSRYSGQIDAKGKLQEPDKATSNHAYKMFQIIITLIVMPRKVSHKEATDGSFYGGLRQIYNCWQPDNTLTILLHGSHHHVLLNDIPGPSNRVRCYLPNGERMRRCCRRGRPARRGPPGTSNNKNLHSQAMSLVFPLTGWEEHISHISVLEVAVIWRQACQIRSFQSTNFKRLQYQQIFPRKNFFL